MKKYIIVGFGAIFIFLFWKNYRSIPISKASLPPQTTLKVGTNIWVGYEPLYLAKKLGYLKNTSIELVEFSNATQVLHAYKSGLIQVAALTLDEVLMLQTLKKKPRVILIVDFSNGADSILGQSNFKSMKEIANKRIGVENTAMGGFFLSRALEASGLSLKNLTIVPLSVGEHEKAFASGQVDALVTFDPTKSNLIKKGAVELFNSSQIPGEIVDTLVTNEQIIETRRKDLQQLLLGWEKAVQLIEQNPEKAMGLISQRLKETPELVSESYRGIHLLGIEQNYKLMNNQDSTIHKTLKTLPDFLIKSKLLLDTVDTSQVLAPSIVNSLKQSQ